MKLKLFVHQKQFSEEELVLNASDFPDIKEGDVVEIYHPDEEYRLLLQVNSLKEDIIQKESISVENTIAQTFQLKVYHPICINLVDPKTVTLDLVEMIIKDQYLSRADMWRFKKNLEKKVIYITKKVEIYSMRACVNELWAKGEKLSCGVISKDTRVVFRSPTAVMNIFIQMSSEMWEFDLFGDLYFEKAVTGFLAELFAKWKEQNCCHDVTIVMFSRSYYKANSRDEFPTSIQECIQQDYKGRFYEDFYRIVVQNERYDEWQSTMIKLKQLFIEYEDRVLHYHEKLGEKVPPAYNSTAAQGNFLETLNMSLNVFEKYYLDRNFDRTGKVAILITPGAGVFEVNRELTTLTKQRTIDSGAGADLVCMGEQPLHAVPLFKFHNKNVVSSFDVGDDYNIPHWINHSFYSSQNQVQACSSSKFIPRIKVPPNPQITKNIEPRRPSCIEDTFPFNVNYDEYDAQIFKPPSSQRRNPTHARSAAYVNKGVSQTLAEAKLSRHPRKRYKSDECLDASKVDKELAGSKHIFGSSHAMSIPTSHVLSSNFTSSSLGAVWDEKHQLVSKSYDSIDSNNDSYLEQLPGSTGNSPGLQYMKHGLPSKHSIRSNRALINPFAPSRIKVKMTFNRRRWVHAFPVDISGTAMQPRFHHTYAQGLDKDLVNVETTNSDVDPSTEQVEAANIAVEERKKKSNTVLPESGSEVDTSNDAVKEVPEMSHCSSLSSLTSRNTIIRARESGSNVSNKNSVLSMDGRDSSYSLLWGVTGEQELCANTAVDVDWKSMSLPAILPVTTDYFPDQRNLENDYVISDYQLLPDDVNMDLSFGQTTKACLKTREVFDELFYQRLAQGFQLICINKTMSPNSQIVDSAIGNSMYKHRTDSMMKARTRTIRVEECWFSIGRLFHNLNLTGNTITVRRYSPRHSQRAISSCYPYRFQVPDSENYDASKTKFCNEQLESFNWNYLDNYICTKGQGDFTLVDSFKFWRSRYFLMSANNPATKKIIDGVTDHCDVYEQKRTEELEQIQDGFLRFMESLNGLKRPASTRKVRFQKPLPDENMGDKENLSLSSTLEKIVDVMADQNNGISFIPSQHGLPANSFVAAEASLWVIQCIENVNTLEEAITLLQKLLDNKLICHVSGDFKCKFLNGFYIYFILSKTEDIGTGLTRVTVTNDDWCEVAFQDKVPQCSSNLLLPSLGQGVASHVPVYKVSHMDVDENTDRKEWGTLQYHSQFNSRCAFEIQMHWLVATGPVLGDTIASLARKASTCSLHLLPVPVDPFALPDTPGSDPLRGPIYVPLLVDCLREVGEDIFPDYDWTSKDGRLHQLQHAILKRYGFIPDNGVSISQHDIECHEKYVHVTGGMFVMILQTKSTAQSPSKIYHSEYVARQRIRTESFCSAKNSSERSDNEQKKVGFLWAWNFLLTRERQILEMNTFKIKY